MSHYVSRKIILLFLFFIVKIFLTFQRFNILALHIIVSCSIDDGKITDKAPVPYFWNEKVKK